MKTTRTSRILDNLVGTSLPNDRPRYLIGVGFLVGGIAAGLLVPQTFPHRSLYLALGGGLGMAATRIAVNLALKKKSVTKIERPGA
jgi:hypothetical protein